jgi:hypothetical protein
MVIGPPGRFFLDHEPLGETNQRYPLPVGEHTCGFGVEAEARSEPCRIDPESSLVRVR